MSEEEKAWKADFDFDRPEDMGDQEFQEFYDRNWRKYDQEAESNDV